MQIITIAGRLGSDAQLRQTQGGDNVASFNVAVDSRQGRDKVTTWWRVSLWGKRGEALSPYLRKGTGVTVIGEFSLGDYEGKPQLNVRASEVALQGGNDRRDGDTGHDTRAPARQADSRQNGTQGGYGRADDLDDQIPF